MLMKIFVTHPTGNRNVRSVVTAFERNGLLAKFGTTMAVDPKAFLLRFIPSKLRNELLRRSYELNFQRIYTRPTLELMRTLLSKFGFKSAVKHEIGFASVDSIYRDMDKGMAAYLSILNKKEKIAAVYAYEDGALATFSAAKEMGISCIYDLPIGYWRTARKLLKNEKERWPEWAGTLTGFHDSEKKLARKDQELKMADIIFVASSFTAKTLLDFPGELAAIKVIPYGFPPVAASRIYADPSNRKIKLLFVGGLSQRKGIADLLAAVKNIGDRVELTIVGRKTNADCLPLDIGLKENTWIPSLPHQEVLKLMQSSDVLIFPSLFEGFGLVITEAMSQGTPVITTDRTAGLDLITHNEDGWIIPAGSTEALQDQIEIILQNPEIIATTGKAAMLAASKRPWDKYEQELAEAIIKNLG